MIFSMKEEDHSVARSIVKDEIEVIQTEVKQWIEAPILTCYFYRGTRLNGRDVTPEAFKGIFEKEIEGFKELFRWLSFKKIGTSTIQSRAIAGVAGGTYMFALPGSTALGTPGMKFSSINWI